METVKKKKSEKKSDSLGDRMKAYENCYRNKIPNRSYVIIRVDGKAFHTFTSKLQKPFDDALISDMNETAKYMCENIQGARLAYVQSDEISIVLTNFENLDTEMWFEGNIQKMCSVSASLATAKFNQLRLLREFMPKVTYQNSQIIKYAEVSNQKLAEFDSRVFIVPNRSEVMNYLLWRQNDAVRNSISMVAQSLYKGKEREVLTGKNSDQLQELSFQRGINWNNLDSGKKRGRLIRKIKYVNGVSEKESPDNAMFLDATIRNKWEAVETPARFTEDGFTFLKTIIPLND